MLGVGKSEFNVRKKILSVCEAVKENVAVVPLPVYADPEAIVEGELKGAESSISLIAIRDELPSVLST